MESNKLIVLTGPSGVGKTEIYKRIILFKELKLKKVITCTTRAPRKGEINGKDYYFISKEEFDKLLKSNNILEHAQVYDDYYCSTKKEVENIINSGFNPLFVVDVQGALKIKEKFSNSLSIFINAENEKEIERRLRVRKSDSIKIIEKRIAKMKGELLLAKRFDYIVINKNNKLNECVKEIRGIVSFKNHLFLQRG